MSIDTDRPNNVVLQNIAPGGRVFADTGNPANVSQFVKNQERGEPEFRWGIVERVGVGSFDVLVQGRSAEMSCSLGFDMVNYFVGVTECNLPVEGTSVLVYLPSMTATNGIIVATGNSAASLPTESTTYPKPVDIYANLWDIEPGKSGGTEIAYTKPLSEKTDLTTRNYNAGRAVDIFPGERAWINEQQVGLAILKFITSLRASDKAKIELSVLDDMVRVVSDLYHHINSAGEDLIYNDGGYITREMSGTIYQWERSGHSSLGNKIFKENNEDFYLSTCKSSKIALEAGDIESRKRWKMLLGYLGGIFDFYVSSPDPSTENDPYLAGDDNIDSGLFKAQIDGSGRLSVRGANGFSFRRSDRIPVPHRKKDPWDPSGAKVDSSGFKPEPKTPFKWPQNHPYARNLLIRDAAAYYDLKMAYRRYDEASDDWYVPEESDMAIPEDKYDKEGKAETDFSSNKNRESYFNMEPDGSIIIRDAWGSEIIMRGGEIILSAANSVKTQSGKDIVQLAGHDIISKARKSIDITATDNDVRIKGNKNVHVVATDKTFGSVLIQSLAEQHVPFLGTTGEFSFSSGIFLKAEKSQVAATGDAVRFNSPSVISFDGYSPPENQGDDPEMTGSIRFHVEDIFAKVNNKMFLGAGDTVSSSTNKAETPTLLQLDAQSSVLISPNIQLLAENSVGVIENSEQWVIQMRVPIIDFDPYEMYKKQATAGFKSFEGQDWLGSFNPEFHNNIHFSYRSSKEYGTHQSPELGDPVEFHVYEPAWAFLARKNYGLLSDTEIDQWEETSIIYELEGNEVETYPWPGLENYETDTYFRLKEETNIQDGVDPSWREDIEDGSSITIEPVSLQEYTVVKT